MSDEGICIYVLDEVHLNKYVCLSEHSAQLFNLEYLYQSHTIPITAHKKVNLELVYHFHLGCSIRLKTVVDSLVPFTFHFKEKQGFNQFLNHISIFI